MKFSATASVLSCATWLLAITTTPAIGHGFLTSPAAEFDPSKMRTSYVDRIQASFPGKFDDSPDNNARNFIEAFKNSQFKNLREMLEPHGPTCGYTLTNVSPKPIPNDGQVTWQNPDSGEGFVPSHTVSHHCLHIL